MSRVIRLDGDPPLVPLREETDGEVLDEANPYHDRRGRFTSKSAPVAGLSYASAPGIALTELANGKQATILPEDVGRFMELAAARKDHPDLTELKVEGTLKFGGDGLGIARKDMPQLPEGAQREAFFSSLRTRGISVTAERINPQLLHPVQKEISASVAGKLMLADRHGKLREDNRLTVSSDNFVIDGHHRWAAKTASSFERPGVTVGIDRVDMPVYKLLGEAETYTKSAGIAGKALGDNVVTEARLDGGAPLIEAVVALDGGAPLIEANPYHAKDGRFTGKGGMGGGLAGQAWLDSLSDDERGAVASYSTTGYRNINAGLRGLEPLTPESAARVKLLDSALSRSVLPEDRVLIRHTDGWETPRPGETFVDKGFVSTATSGFRADEGARLVITAKAGQKGASISPVTRQESEGEILLPRNSSFRVDSFNPITGETNVTYLGQTAALAESAVDDQPVSTGSSDKFVWGPTDVVWLNRATEANPYHDQRGRFAAKGGGGHSPALDAKLSEVEGQIRDRDGGEDIFVLSPNGDVIETNTAIGNATGAPGAIASVSLSGSNAKYAGAIVTHNHPAMGDSDDLLRRYDSFSPDDIRSAMGMGLSEARMVNKVSTQVLRPGPKGWGTPQEFREAAAHNFLNHDYKEPRVNENGVPSVYFKRIDATRDIAKAMGWSFEVIPQ